LVRVPRTPQHYKSDVLHKNINDINKISVFDAQKKNNQFREFNDDKSRVVFVTIMITILPLLLTILAFVIVAYKGMAFIQCDKYVRGTGWVCNKKVQCESKV
jgi:hypothetical protein